MNTGGGQFTPSRFDSCGDLHLVILLQNGRSGLGIRILFNCIFFAFQAEGTPVLQCVEDALGAASDCLRCICDIIHIVDTGSGICE